MPVPAVCNDCGDTFAKKWCLDRHIRSKHAAKVMTYQCAICRNSYARQDNLKRHERKSHRPNRDDEHDQGIDEDLSPGQVDFQQLDGFGSLDESNETDATVTVPFTHSSPIHSLDELDMSTTAMKSIPRSSSLDNRSYHVWVDDNDDALWNYLYNINPPIGPFAQVTIPQTGGSTQQCPPPTSSVTLRKKSSIPAAESNHLSNHTAFSAPNDDDDFYTYISEPLPAAWYSGISEFTSNHYSGKGLNPSGKISHYLPSL